MRNLVILLIFQILTSSFLLFSLIEEGNDWPGWRGIGRDGVVEDFIPPERWPDMPSKVRQQNIGLGDASPVLVSNKLFLLVKQEDNEVALCLDAKTGNQVWKTVNNVAPEVTGPPSSHPGPRSTPCVAQDKVYTLGVGGALTCLDAQTGKIIWKNNEYTDVPTFYVGMSPLVTDNKCIVHLGGPESGVIIAFNAGSGEKIWTIEGEPPTYSSPVTMTIGDENILIVQTETDVIGVSMDGNVLFKIPTPVERRFYNASTPVIDGQNIIIAGQGLGTKSYKIQKSGNNYSFSENWINPDFGVSFNTPVIKNGYIYGHEARLGKLFCLDASTGGTSWADSTAHNRFASLLILDNYLLSLDATATLSVLEVNQDQYIQKAAYKIADTDIYAHPLVVGNMIYVKDKEMITCWVTR